MHINKNDALLLIDLQNDFMEKGALAVQGSCALFPKINILIKQNFKLIIASRDWHPQNHSSFQENNGPWPTHCVAGSHGADFTPLLDTAPLSHIIHKGREQDAECYSAFFNEKHQSTGLDAVLTSQHIKRVFIAGLVLDYCVKATAIDAQKLGFETIILSQYCASIEEKTSLLKFLEKEEKLFIYDKELALPL